MAAAAAVACWACSAGTGGAYLRYAGVADDGRWPDRVVPPHAGRWLRWLMVGREYDGWLLLLAPAPVAADADWGRCHSYPRAAGGWLGAVLLSAPLDLALALLAATARCCRARRSLSLSELDE